MNTPFALPMKSSLIPPLCFWLSNCRHIVARCGFWLALVTGFTTQPVGAAEPTDLLLHFEGNGSYLEFLPPLPLDAVPSGEAKK